MSKQTRLMSALEVATNIFIGYSVALATQLVIFPLFDIHIPFSDNFMIGGIFTVISIIRSYVFRRLFEWLRVEKGFNFGKTIGTQDPQRGSVD